MAVNLWASVVLLGDQFYCGADSSGTPSLDFLVSENLTNYTKKKQIWMTIPLYNNPGGTAETLRTSYELLKSSGEAYLCLFAPGYSDLVRGVPVEEISRQFEQLCRMCLAFNKRVITPLLGKPAGVPDALVAKVSEYNQAVSAVVETYKGYACDASGLNYLPWSSRGSTPEKLEELAKIISQSVINSHTNPQEWERYHNS